MVELNLLAWREQKHAYERARLRYFLALSLAVVLFVSLGLHGYLCLKINKQTQQVVLLRAALPKDSHVNWPVPAIAVAHHLLEPSVILHFLQVMTESAQHGICYQRVTRDDNHLSLFGQAKSLSSANAGLHALEAAALFSSLKLRELKQVSKSEPLQFIFEARGA